MMPGGLIRMDRCGGVIFQACARCGHASSELTMLLAASWRKKDPSPLDFEVGRFGNYSGGSRMPNHVRTVRLGNSAAVLSAGGAECRWRLLPEPLRWPNSPLERALSERGVELFRPKWLAKKLEPMLRGTRARQRRAYAGARPGSVTSWFPVTWEHARGLRHRSSLHQPTGE